MSFIDLSGKCCRSVDAIFFIDIGVALIKDNTFSITPDELLSFYSFNLLLCSISPQHQQSFSRTVCRYQLWRDQKEIGRK